MTCRVALLTPFAFPSVRGNAITVERIARGLAGRGVDLVVHDLSVLSESAIEREMAALRPVLLHAFHAYRAGPLARRLAERAGIPLVVTMTGTDANHDLLDPARALAVRSVLAAAGRITVFHDTLAARVGRALPGVAARIVVVPQSVSFEREDAAPPPPAPGRGPTLLFPAGVRMVKNPRFPLPALDAVAERHPGLTLQYVGPVLDAAEGEALFRDLSGRPWARYLGSVPHHRMRALVAAADIVLNCSISEGGMANSVLEALALGRAVLASDIEGNRSLIEDGVTGLLFSTAEEFAERVERLLDDPALRRRLGETGRALVESRFPAARELDGYLDVYESLAGVVPDAYAGGDRARPRGEGSAFC
jgi:glycosyltransferase involved in cell wall biosynthesis